MAIDNDGYTYGFEYSSIDGKAVTIPNGVGFTLNDLKPWPPLERTVVDHTVMGGSQAKDIAWRGAELSVVFIAGDTSMSAPWPDGYEIPDTLQCRVYPGGSGLSEIPSVMLAPGRFSTSTLLMYNDRHGYMSDGSGGAPRGAFTMADYEWLCLNSDVLVVGIPFWPYWNRYVPHSGPGPWRENGVQDANGYYVTPIYGPSDYDGANWMSCASAMTGAGSEIPEWEDVGYIISDYQMGLPAWTSPTAADIARGCMKFLNRMIEIRGVKTVDICFAQDNTGSMGGQRELFRQASIDIASQLVDIGIDAYFAYTTYAEWGWEHHPNYPNNSSGDTPYAIQWPFGPLNAETLDAYSAAVSGFPFEYGGDTPETAIEALCRIMDARVRLWTPRSIKANTGGSRVHFVRTGRQQ